METERKCGICGYVWEDGDSLEYDPYQRMYICVPGDEDISPCQYHGYANDDGEFAEESDDIED